MNLTPKQKALLSFIEEYRRSKGFAPSQQEIANHFGFRSLGTVQNYLVRLERQGALRKNLNATRGLVSCTSQLSSKLVELELVGFVAAGHPIEALENRETVPVPQSLVGLGNHFVLRVKGESMTDEGILDGDQVIIRKQRTAENGQTVVALIAGEATIKKYYLKAGRVELHPAHPAFRPILIDPAVTQDFQIEGVMVGLIRRY